MGWQKAGIEKEHPLHEGSNMQRTQWVEGGDAISIFTEDDVSIEILDYLEEGETLGNKIKIKWEN
ncbi:hypothetical protein HZY62_12685 [Maribacter polysiphoniae]|uniref:Uncharacterized protein n=1 Tax=Maribacter polysiphoniae TaxID=429344 RepID=A0A316DZD8_9FLAO|nr:hypothetical protein [Maribacter polysiphoniae]MBD1261453.1 hypothetical protein [Maribacter polysiphoniae]PWK22788.1 hypothetical protein LX92_02725 [Maribacter polysiphoniae]